MKKPVSVIIVGAGGRGFAYANLALKMPKPCKIVGVAEPRDFHREKMVKEHGIKPESVRAAVKQIMSVSRTADESISASMDEEEKRLAIENLEEQMLAAAADLDFEKAAKLRDRMLELKGEKVMLTNEKSKRSKRKNSYK